MILNHNTLQSRSSCDSSGQIQDKLKSSKMNSFSVSHNETVMGSGIQPNLSRKRSKKSLKKSVGKGGLLVAAPTAHLVVSQQVGVRRDSVPKGMSGPSRGKTKSHRGNYSFNDHREGIVIEEFGRPGFKRN